MINIFPPLKMNSAELMQISISLNEPAVKKYFQLLAYSTGSQLCEGSRAQGETAEEYLCKEALLKGALSLLDMLSNIESPDSISGNSAVR